MHSVASEEHFATLFDRHFLLQGLCLHASLVEHGAPFRLWVLCLDQEVEDALRQFDLPHVELIPLADAETEGLRRVKAERSIAEYCWTLTPFLPGFVFDRAPDLNRITYIDADLFFFGTPRLLFDEFDASRKHVLITDHAFAPEYRDRVRFGRFCVQFMTFRHTPEGLRVLHWWRDRCLEWCYARDEDGKFGDQKYLDDWPERFTSEVHVLAQTEKTLAPWNVEFVERTHGRVAPVFYHFHALRHYRPDMVRLFAGYRIGKRNLWLYDAYLDKFRRAVREARAHGIEPTPIPLPRTPLSGLRNASQWLTGRLRDASV